MTLIAVAVAVLAGPPSAPPIVTATPHRTMPGVIHSHRPPEATRRCNRTRSVRACIRHAARKHHVSEAWLRAVAWCESRFNPGAYNASSGASGLFQYVGSPGGIWAVTPYRRRSPWDAKWAALATAWLFHRGYSSHWACA